MSIAVERIILDSEECCQTVRRETGPIALLAFSRGKDAIASWLQLRRHFEEVRPIFFYTVPGLEFEEESIDYFERFFQAKIRRLPHPSMNRQLNAMLFQAPGNCAVIEAAQLPEYDYVDCFAEYAQDLGIAEDTPYATGVRAADSPMRRISYKKHGLWRRGKQMWLPIGDWNKQRTMQAIADSGIRLPVDYQWFKRSFDGLDYRFMGPLKKHAPRDFARILEFFPLIEADLFRYEKMGFRP